jgi:hypothetical protein
MNATLLEQFLTEECTPFVRNLISDGLEAARAGAGTRRGRFEFNRFEITFDLDTESVLIEDVLDPTEVGAQRVSVTEFVAALSAKR